MRGLDEIFYINLLSLSFFGLMPKKIISFAPPAFFFAAYALTKVNIIVFKIALRLFMNKY